MKLRCLIKTGYLPPILFWGTNLLCGILLPGYNHATKLVSELGSVGTSTQGLFTAGLVLCALSSVLFIAGLYITAKRTCVSVIPVVLLTTYSFSILGAALFPFPLKLHGILGMPVIVLFLSPLTALLLWPPKVIIRVRLYTLLALTTMLLGFLVYAPAIMNEFFGIKQRFFHLGWTIWFIFLSSAFSNLGDPNTSRPGEVSNEKQVTA